MQRFNWFGAQGWICPRCGAGNAPYMPTCPCINRPSETVTWFTTDGRTQCTHAETEETTAGTRCKLCGQIVFKPVI